MALTCRHYLLRDFLAGSVGDMLGVARFQIVHQTAIQELDEIVEYVNRFHHDTNAAWETEAIKMLNFVGSWIGRCDSAGAAEIRILYCGRIE
jgi:hypothetical protein